jgi:hypothetical protein
MQRDQKPGDSAVKAWHDGMLQPGDEWHAKVLNALADADLALLLVSRALLSSKYAGETEIPFALERAWQGKAKLVPVILESCDWTKMPFAKYQALPGDRVPIAERADVDNALNDCLERLRRVFEPNKAVKFRSESKMTGKSRPLLRLTLDGTTSDWPNWSDMIAELRKVAHNSELRTNLATRLRRKTALLARIAGSGCWKVRRVHFR